MVGLLQVSSGSDKIGGSVGAVLEGADIGRTGPDDMSGRVLRVEAMFVEIHGRVQEENPEMANPLDGAALNLHPGDWVDILCNWPQHLGPPDTKLPVLYGLAMRVTELVPQGVGLVVVHDTVVGSVNFDAGTVWPGRVPESRGE